MTNALTIKPSPLHESPAQSELDSFEFCSAASMPFDLSRGFEALGGRLLEAYVRTVVAASASRQDAGSRKVC